MVLAKVTSAYHPGLFRGKVAIETYGGTGNCMCYCTRVVAFRLEKNFIVEL